MNTSASPCEEQSYLATALDIIGPHLLVINSLLQGDQERSLLALAGFA